MSSFKDKQGNLYTIHIDAPTIQEIRTSFDGLDLANVDGQAYSRLADDPCLLVDVLYLLCREQADKRDISARDFGRNLVGDAIDDATQAMLGGIANFFPQKKRDYLMANARRTRALQEAAIDKAMQRVGDAALEIRVMEIVDQRLTADIENALTRFSSVTTTPDL